MIRTSEKSQLTGQPKFQDNSLIRTPWVPELERFHCGSRTVENNIYLVKLFLVKMYVVLVTLSPFSNLPAAEINKTDL